jgi:hypothetical protein
MTPSETLLCSLLCGGPTCWPNGDDPTEIAAFLDEAYYHGVMPLVDAIFQSSLWSIEWPEAIRFRCRVVTRAEAASELARRAEMARVLRALASAKIESLLLKGTGLAYGCYANPTLRTRVDTDLLVRPESKDIASGVLQSLGYRRVEGPAGIFVGYQLALRRDDRFGMRQAIDLHWRISNVQTFAWRFSFDELAGPAVPVPNLDRHAMRLGNAHSLLLSLLHRVGANVFQEPGFGDRLIWHYDNKLLVDQMLPTEIEEFTQMVDAKGVGAIALDGLRACVRRFGSPRLNGLIQNLTESPTARAGSVFVNGGRLKQEWVEVLAIPGFRSRLRYLAQRAFPAAEFMREMYPESASRSLAYLHARHLLQGFGRLITNARR